MADIFISYARADREKIEKLASALEAEGYSVWWDRQIVGGSEFSEEIEKELNAAKAVIVAWSEDSVKSRWVRDEAGTAAEAGKLIPTSLDGAGAPMGFKQYHAIDLDGWNEKPEAHEFQDVSRAVKARLSGAMPGPAAPKHKSWFARIFKKNKKNENPLTTLIKGVIAVAIVFVALKYSGPKMVSRETPPSIVEAGADIEHKEGVPDQPAIQASDAASIAVLPFADLSPDGDQEYFSDGISEEILNVLVRVGGLSVASRTSSFQFKGQESIGIPVIADELNVRHILEGSVRKAGNTVRITAQLIDAQTDQHLWSETYDRTLTVENLFAVQDEIAQEIVNVLGVRLAGGGAQIVDVVADTGNLDAYELYLEAQNRFLQRSSNSPDYFRETIGMFEQITRIDPDFARGWAGLAGAASIAGARLVTDRDYAAIAREAAIRAIELNPDVSLPYAVLARLEERKSPPNYEAAQDYYETAIKKDPRETTVYHWLAYSLLQLGYADRAIEYSEQCLALDPTYQNCRGNIAAAYFRLGDYEKAMAYKRETLLAGAAYSDYDYLYYLAQTGRDDAVIGYIIGNVRIFDGEQWMIEPIYRAVTDPEYDRADSLQRIKTRFEASGRSWSTQDPLFEFVHLTHGAYRELELFEGVVIWGALIPDYVASPERKRLFREAGLPDYWRKHGWPDKCKPVGDDDFECD